LNGVGARPFSLKPATRAPGGQPQYFSNDVLSNPSDYFSSPQTLSVNLGGNVQTAPGNLPRNSFTGPSWWNFDLSLLKDTHLTERISAQFRAEAFNVFNHPTFASLNGSSVNGNPATPNGTLGNGSFGVSTATQTSERQIQFGLRLIF
jgi:hypothetical protein